MGLIQKQQIHTGEERYEREFTYEGEELERVARQTEPGQIIVDTIVVIWTRRVGEPWARYTRGRSGSRVEGYTQLRSPAPGARGVRRTKELFKRGDVPEFLPWVGLLPGLRNAVEEAEVNLPHPSVNPFRSGLTK